MTYVVTESCVKCKYTDCVDVCPVDCFREGPNMLVIDRLTLWEAANHRSGLEFLFIGAAIVVPFIVLYTVIAYRIFRGKAAEGLYD